MVEVRQSQASRAEVGQTLDLERYVPALLVFLANKITNGSSNIFRKNFGVGVIEWRCMGVIAGEPWASPSRICQVIGLDKAAVSRSIRLLAEKRLVEIRSSSHRRRFLEVALTEKGCRLYDRMAKLALEREKRLLADIRADELELLISMLNRMHKRIPTFNDPIDIPQ